MKHQTKAEALPVNKWLILAMGAGLLATAIALTPALAAGGGSSGTRGTGLTCPAGWVLNQATGKCQRQSSSLDQQEIPTGWDGADPQFVEAAVLAHSGQYQAAIAALSALQRPEDPYVLNYLGYSNRKLGNNEVALDYYHKALSIRPDYVRAREYMGEGLVAMGRIDEARDQLALIAEQCGTTCDEYVKLERTISEYVGRNAS